MRYIKLFEDFIDKIFKNIRLFDYEKLSVGNPYSYLNKYREDGKIVNWTIEETELIINFIDKIEGLDFNEFPHGINFPSKLERKRM